VHRKNILIHIQQDARLHSLFFALHVSGGTTTTVSTALVDIQLDAPNSYLFIHNIFIKIFYMFRPLTCSSAGGLRCKCIYAASGIVTLCR
jgi:hypothetical protein